MPKVFDIQTYGVVISLNERWGGGIVNFLGGGTFLEQHIVFYFNIKVDFP